MQLADCGKSIRKDSNSKKAGEQVLDTGLELLMQWCSRQQYCATAASGSIAEAVSSRQSSVQTFNLGIICLTAVALSFRLDARK